MLPMSLFLSGFFKNINNIKNGIEVMFLNKGEEK
jgi:hypothetical protein